MNQLSSLPSKQVFHVFAVTLDQLHVVGSAEESSDGCRRTKRSKRRRYAAPNVGNFHDSVPSDQIVVFVFGGAPELSRSAAMIRGSCIQIRVIDVHWAVFDPAPY